MQDNQGRRDQPEANEPETFLGGSERAESGRVEPSPGVASFAIPGEGKDHEGDVVQRPVGFDVLSLSDDPGGVEPAPGMAWFAIPGQGKDTQGDSPAE